MKFKKNKSSEKDVAISVKNLSKSFRLPHESQNSIKGKLINFHKRGYEVQKVLKGISFDIEKGDFFGIVGRNGSGKSTLLKILSGIYCPDSGSVQINGKLTPFIELGVGFNPELSGRDNVFLNGALLGFSRKEMEEKYDDIVKFAELEQFMDQKLKNYSSGMQVRLAFSIAIRANTDILVLDEVLAVGDEAFQRKCYNFFASLKQMKKTVVLVTHSMDQVQRFCNKAALIDKGSKFTVGKPAEIAETYRELNSSNIKKNQNGKNKSEIVQVASKFKNENNKNLHFEFDLDFKKKVQHPVLTFTITHNGGGLVYRWVSDEEFEKPIEIKSNKAKLTLDIQNIFPNGEFSVEFGVKSENRLERYGLFQNIVQFELNNRDKSGVNIYWKPNVKMKISN